VLDHVALEVADLARAARFYDAIMRPLGGRRIVDSPDGIGYGRDRPDLWIMPRAADDARRATAGNAAPARGHVGIAAAGRRAVDAAHAAGLAAGARRAGVRAAQLLLRISGRSRRRLARARQRLALAEAPPGGVRSAARAR
jgi:catechol 2,3-dioxygenase-like lactoylglutathione lyase family enzyme